MSKKTRVVWSFNRFFRNQRTFPSKAAAFRYMRHLVDIWGAGINVNWKVL